jgi:hypothetical protein
MIIQIRYCATKEDCKNSWRGWTPDEIDNMIKGLKNYFHEFEVTFCVYGLFVLFSNVCAFLFIDCDNL